MGQYVHKLDQNQIIQIINLIKNELRDVCSFSEPPKCGCLRLTQEIEWFVALLTKMFFGLVCRDDVRFCTIWKLGETHRMHSCNWNIHTSRKGKQGVECN